MERFVAHDWRWWTWVAWCCAAILALPLLDTDAIGPIGYGSGVAATALLIALATGTLVRDRRRLDVRDLVVIAGLYVVVVGLFVLAFRVFTTGNVLGLFLSFAAAMLVGVAGPIVYTVWFRGRPLSSLGLGAGHWRAAVGLGAVLAVLQFAVTFAGRPLPADPVDWVPLLVMAITVGAFETVFFRGFVQDRLRASFGQGAGVAGGAVLYGLYHVGYGMAAPEMLFLTGLGVLYGVAYALVRNALVLWPLLTPLGSFFSNLSGAEFELPWASILGFADVLGLMAAAIWLAGRHRRRMARAGAATEVREYG
jgi:membrane protease YdiL (CAAX protease family)